MLVRAGRAELMKEWKVQDDEQKKKNSEATAAWNAPVQEWEKECDRAKAVKTRPHWKKPIRGSLLPPIPKPTAPVANDKDGEDPGKNKNENDETDNEPEED